MVHPVYCLAFQLSTLRCLSGLEICRPCETRQKCASVYRQLDINTCAVDFAVPVKFTESPGEHFQEAFSLI